MVTHHKNPMLDLFLACKSGDCEIIERIILGGIDVNARNDEPIIIEGLTYWRNPTLKPTLWVMDCTDFNATFIGCTPLHIACFFRQKKAVELLLSKLRADITVIADEIMHHHSSSHGYPIWRFESVTALHIIVCGNHIDCDKALANYMLHHIMRNDIEAVEIKATAVEWWFKGPITCMYRRTAFQLAIAFLENGAEIVEDLVVLGRAYRGVSDFDYIKDVSNFSEEDGGPLSNDPRSIPGGRDYEHVFDLDLDEITRYKNEFTKVLSNGLKDMPDYIIDCVKDFAEPTTRELVQMLNMHNSKDNYNNCTSL